MVSQPTNFSRGSADITVETISLHVSLWLLTHAPAIADNVTNFTGWTSSTACAGDPECQRLLLAIGPERMAVMMKQLGVSGAVQAVRTMGPANAAAVTIIELGPKNAAELFINLGADFSAGEYVNMCVFDATVASACLLLSLF